jgi:hypothetical protein
MLGWQEKSNKIPLFRRHMSRNEYRAIVYALLGEFSFSMGRQIFLGEIRGL